MTNYNKFIYTNSIILDYITIYDDTQLTVSQMIAANIGDVLVCEGTYDPIYGIELKNCILGEVGVTYANIENGSLSYEFGGNCKVTKIDCI